MLRAFRFHVPIALLFALGIAASALAVPYASGVRDLGGNMWEFVLNDDAAEVTVLRDGGNALTLGTTAGRHTFDMTGFSDFAIEVSNSAPAEWTTISDAANLFTNFEQGNGLAVNSNPASPFFGTIYVINSRANATVSGRAMANGAYSLTADLQGVDLANNFAVVTDPNDTSQAKAPGWTVDVTQPLNPWRMTLDDGGNLIVSDWTDLYGGIKYASADLTMGGLVLREESGPTGGVFSDVSDDFGPIPLHGSIVSKPIVTGTLGTDLTVWAIDEDLDSGLAHPGTNGNSVWRWDVGSATEYAINPTLVIDALEIPNTPLPDNRANWLALNVGVLANADYSAEYDKWYLSQNRSNGGEAGLIVITADGVDGNAPTLEWSSLQFSIDNNLDGFTDDPEVSASAGIQDIFRHMGGGITLSPDGTELYLHRVAQFAGNDVLGAASDLSGAVLVIPLDENGIPDIQVEAGAITNMDSITTVGNGANASRREVVLDAAGNVYTTNNNSELLEVFSPGGDTTAITTSDGMFSVVPLIPPVEGLVGDYNNDGSVNAADYTVWRDNLGAATLEFNRDPDNVGAVDQADYDAWAANFGSTAGSGSTAAVPEPTTIALAGLALLGLIGLARRK